MFAAARSDAFFKSSVFFFFLLSTSFRGKFAHRDLAARNLLVHELPVAEGGGLEIKVSDFGLSRGGDHLSSAAIQQQTSMPIRWLAPECLLDSMDELVKKKKKKKKR